jgi:hypothetical protein
MKKFKNVILYIDTFGTKYHFFIDKKPKYYTIMGGLFSLSTFLICIAIFFLAIFKNINPSITTSIISNAKITFQKNRIFLPWKITSDNRFRNNINMILSSEIYNDKKLINYKLCNETSMINLNNLTKNKSFFHSLEDLYCIDLGELFNNEYYISINIIFDLHTSNINNNSFQLDLFYPIIAFNPDSFTEPLLNKYQNHSIDLRRNIINKGKIILGEYSVLDKYGFFGTKQQFFSLWGTNSIFSENINVINNNASLAIFALNIILDLKKVYYKRYHTTFFTVFIDKFPICYIIFKFIKCILQSFILAESNSKIFELLFEKLVEKEDKSEIYKTKMRFRSLAGIRSPDLKKNNTNKKVTNVHTMQNENLNINIISKDLAFLESNKDNKNKNVNLDTNNLVEKEIKRFNLDDLYDNNMSKNSQRNLSLIKLSKVCKKKSRRSVDYGSPINNSQKRSNLFLINPNILINKNINENSIHLDGSKYSILQDNKDNKISISKSPSHKYSKFKNIRLFPYKYYFFSLFLKNYDILNCKSFFSLKYKKVFTFMGQALDIKSYLLLIKEFEIMKNIYCNKDDFSLIENNKKINVNSTKFNREIKDCIENNKFNILYNRAK